jgi:hypothetical protein
MCSSRNVYPSAKGCLGFKTEPFCPIPIIPLKGPFHLASLFWDYWWMLLADSYGHNRFCETAVWNPKGTQTSYTPDVPAHETAVFAGTNRYEANHNDQHQAGHLQTLSLFLEEKCSSSSAWILKNILTGDDKKPCCY